MGSSASTNNTQTKPRPKSSPPPNKSALNGNAGGVAGETQKRNAPKSAVSCIVYITKTCLYNFDPLKPHFYIVKLGFIGVYIIFLISAQNIDCGYSLEPPRRGGSNEYPQSTYVMSRSLKNIGSFYLKNFHYLVVKFSVYLNRHVFVMCYTPRK